MVIKRRRNVRTRKELPTEADRPEPKTDELPEEEVASLLTPHDSIYTEIARRASRGQLAPPASLRRVLGLRPAVNGDGDLADALRYLGVSSSDASASDAPISALDQIISLMADCDPCPECNGLGAVAIELPIAHRRWMAAPCRRPDCVPGQVHRLVYGLKQQALQRAGVNRDGTRD